MGYLLAFPDAQVAQLVEHATENRSVGGSIPPLGTILKSLGFWQFRQSKYQPQVQVVSGFADPWQTLSG
jgi:hypothetical protein